MCCLCGWNIRKRCSRRFILHPLPYRHLQLFARPHFRIRLRHMSSRHRQQRRRFQLKVCVHDVCTWLVQRLWLRELHVVPSGFLVEQNRRLLLQSLSGWHCIFRFWSVLQQHVRSMQPRLLQQRCRQRCVQPLFRWTLLH